MLAMWTASADIGVKCTCAGFSPLSDFLAVGTDDGAVSIFNPKTGRILSKLGASYTKSTNSLSSALEDNGRGMTMSVRFNPASPSKPKARVALSTGIVEGWDIKTKSSNATNVVENGQTLALDYGPDGRHYAAGGMDQQTPDNRGHAVRVYDDATSKLVRSLEGDCLAQGHSNRISCVRFKKDRELASGSMDGTIKLWSIGSKDPIASLPGGSDGTFEIIGNSIDFYGDYMIVGSARPHKHLLLYDMRMNRLVSEVAWRKMKPAASAAARRWNVAKLASLQKTNIIAAGFVDGKIVAGGSGSNMVKVFNPIRSSAPVAADAFPVDQSTAENGELRDLYKPVARFEVPSAVMGLHVSPQPVLRKGELIGDQECREDAKIIAVAASSGQVYGVKMPSSNSTSEPII